MKRVLYVYLLLGGYRETAPVDLTADAEGALGVAVEVFGWVVLPAGRTHLVRNGVQHLDVQLLHLKQVAIISTLIHIIKVARGD